VRGFDRLAYLGTALIAALSIASSAAAQEADAPQASQAAGGSATEQSPARGAGALHVSLSYYGDAFDTLSGGIAIGPAYQGRLGLIADADLDALLGWKGATAHLSVHQIHGPGITQDHVGALMGVSGIEAEPATRLFNLWIEQKIGNRLAVRVGQFTAGQEFFISSNAAMFVNATFGWPAIVAQDLPSGGPAYPLATPGVRLSFKPDSRTTILAAIFNGDPAGPGGGDPQRRDGHGFNSFRISGPPFLIGEVQRAFGRSPTSDPDTMIRLGAWAYLGKVDDQRLDNRGDLLADPGSTGIPARLRGDAGVYGIVDQVLLRGEDQELGAFVRAAATKSDRNLVDLYADAGLTWKGAIHGRADDIAGVAIGYSRISAADRARDMDTRRLTDPSLPVRDHEIVFELSYQARVDTHWSVQPDLQYFVDPGGSTAIPDAVVAGIRNIVRF